MLKYVLIFGLLAAPVPAWASPQVVVGGFSSCIEADGVPCGWQLSERSGKAEVSVVQEGDIHALRLRSNNASFSLQKRFHVDPRHYPVISWKWKVTKLPEGGDFRRSKTDDQAAQLFVAFSNSKVIVYIWDTTAPRGAMDDAWSPPFMTIKAIVVRSGAEETGRWIREARNAYEDYRRIFGHEPPNIAGVRIQINTQHTETFAESFFADLVFAKPGSNPSPRPKVNGDSEEGRD
jgi:hypothetical protein